MSNPSPRPATGPAHPSGVVPLRVPIPLAATQGTLALDLEPRRDPPSVAVGGGATARVVHLDPQRRSIEAWARRFAQAVVEIVGGDRPATQLLRWTERGVYLDLRRRAVLVARAGGHTPGVGRVQTVRPRVESVHCSTVNEQVVETCIRIRYGERSRAIAARFEERQHGWVCTALEFV